MVLPGSTLVSCMRMNMACRLDGGTIWKVRICSSLAIQSSPADWVSALSSETSNEPVWSQVSMTSSRPASSERYLTSVAHLALTLRGDWWATRWEAEGSVSRRRAMALPAASSMWISPESRNTADLACSPILNRYSPGRATPSV